MALWNYFTLPFKIFMGCAALAAAGLAVLVRLA